MDLGPHAAFIWVSYALFYGVLCGVILWVFWSGSRLKTKIREFEARGVARRSPSRSL